MDFWDLREARDGAAVERVGGWSAYWFGKTDPRKRVWFQTNGAVERRQHGRMADVVDDRSRCAPRPPSRSTSCRTATGRSAIRAGTTRATTATARNTYFFADLDSRELDVTLRGTYTFTPTLTLQAYAQLFLAGGHFDNPVAAIAAGKGIELPFRAFRPSPMPGDDAPDFRDGAINVNLVLRWEFLPGSTILGVYTHAQGQTTYDPTIEGFGRPSFTRFTDGPATDLFLVKLSLLLL